MTSLRRTLIVASLLIPPDRSGAFVMTLGRDTVQVERFEQTGNVVTGVLAVRAPTARLLHYVITLRPDGRWASYSHHWTAGDGSVLTPDPGPVTMRYTGDSIIRDVVQRGQPVTHRIAAPQGAFPAGTIPIGASFVVLEHAVAAARATPTPPDPALYRLSGFAQQTQPSRTPILYASPDSVAVDYFGQGSFGLKFDAAGQLIRSDWSGTTYKVAVVRVAQIDAEAMARAWSADDAAGRGMGPISRRDTLRAAAGAASVTVEYSRPSRRGRQIWGGVVPWGAVWRLGADFATHLRTDADLVVGEAVVPAGAYTLWMVPSSDAALLVVNKQTGIFGTQYNAAHDLVRIPMQRRPLAASVERLTISIAGGWLQVEWGDAVYSCRIGTAPND